MKPDHMHLESADLETRLPAGTSKPPQVCILSTSTRELTTEEVMDWLSSFDIHYVRVNGRDLESAAGWSVDLCRDNLCATISIGGATFRPEDVKVVWLRKWNTGTRRFLRGVFPPTVSGEANCRVTARHLQAESETASQFFHSLFASARWLSAASDPNKAQVLSLASKCGLDIPHTVITNDRDALAKFCSKHASAITKPLSNPLILTQQDGSTFLTYTAELSPRLLSSLPKPLFPCWAQENLPKLYDIRTFYLDGACYSMAIFSQVTDEGAIDFRCSRWNAHRNVPYALPDDVQDGIRKLMGSLQFDTGSLDLVRTVDGRIVFLEVNPVGQFGMVSKPCNYCLEEKVAAALVRRLYEKH